MLVESKYVLDNLSEMCGATVLLTMRDYYEDIPFSTKTEKKEYLFNLLRKELNLPLIEGTVNLLHYYIEDIDKTSWTLKSVLSTYDLSTRPDLNL
jgi:hypothetical protein